MADDTATPDEFGKDFADTLEANQALLRSLKYEFGQQMMRAQAGDGDPPSAAELQAIKKLEGQLQNDVLYEQARRLTIGTDA